MLSRLKQFLLIGVVIAVLYGLLSYHFVFFTFKDVEMIKKEEPTLRYTFYNVAGKTPEMVLKVDTLRYVGIGDLMVSRGLLSQERLNQILRRIDMSQ